jgi:hypothetical protein
MIECKHKPCAFYLKNSNQCNHPCMLNLDDAINVKLQRADAVADAAERMNKCCLGTKKTVVAKIELADALREYREG